MRLLFKYSTLAFLLLFLGTCKRYDEGGFVNKTLKNLCGGKRIGSSKTWNLEKYEVNGIDSTFLIAGTSNIPNYPKDFISFTNSSKGDPSPGYTAKTHLFDYRGKIGLADEYITLGYVDEILDHNDSAQCKLISNSTICSRNIFFPEFNNYGKIWNIIKLTKKECILTSDFQLKNKYKIVLSFK